MHLQIRCAVQAALFLETAVPPHPRRAHTRAVPRLPSRCFTRVHHAHCDAWDRPHSFATGSTKTRSHGLLVGSKEPAACRRPSAYAGLNTSNRDSTCPWRPCRQARSNSHAHVCCVHHIISCPHTLLSLLAFKGHTANTVSLAARQMVAACLLQATCLPVAGKQRPLLLYRVITPAAGHALSFCGSTLLRHCCRCGASTPPYP